MRHLVSESSAAAGRAGASGVYPGLGTPSQVFSALTGLFGSGSPMPPDTYAMTRGKKVSRPRQGDLEDFERHDMSAEDRNKVAVWEALFNDMGTVYDAEPVHDGRWPPGSARRQANVTPRARLGKHH